MKPRTLYIALFSLPFILAIRPVLTAQHDAAGRNWAGLQGAEYFQSTRIDTVIQQTTFPPTTEQRVNHVHAIGLGAHSRWFTRRKSYHQVEASLRSRVEKATRTLFNPGFPNEPSTVGTRIMEQRIQLGYRYGRLLRWTDRLRQDLSIGVSVTRGVRDTFFLSGLQPRVRRRLALGVHAYTGLNYQLHRCINVGYNFSMLSFTFRRFRLRRYNFSGEAFIDTEDELILDAFDDVKTWRNFWVRYVF